MIKNGDVVTTYIAFIQNPQNGKYRTAFVINSDYNGQIITVLNITHKYKSKSPKVRQHYFPLKHWRQYGLKEPSYIDILNKSTLVVNAFHTKKIGYIPSSVVKQMVIFAEKYRENMNNL